MSITSNQTAGQESDNSALLTTVRNAARAALREDLSTYTTWITADLAMRTCDKTSCPCVLIAIDESRKYIAQIDDAVFDALLLSMFRHTRE